MEPYPGNDLKSKNLPLLPRSKPSNFFTSSPSKTKSKILIFCRNLSGFTLFGIAVISFCIRNLNKTCGTVLLCFLAISRAVASFRISGMVILKQVVSLLYNKTEITYLNPRCSKTTGRPGDPRGA